MRVFGCLVYARNIETKGDKFEVRGRPGVFIGYPQGQKGYRIYDIDTHKTIVSRDVKFVEDKFPFMEIRDEVKEDCAETRESDWEIEDTTTDDALHNSENIDDGMEGKGTRENDEETNEELTTDAQVVLEDPVNDPVTQDTEATTQGQREQRNRAPPKRFEDFVVKLPPSIDHARPTHHQASSTVHPLTHYLSYDKFSDKHKAFLSAIGSNCEPKHFK